jgi:lipopolysaccharide export system protein LptA
MSRVAVIIGVIALCLCAIEGWAESLALGKATVSARVLEWDGQTISAKGAASLVITPPSTPLKLGQVRLESMKAETIALDLVRNQTKKLVMQTATASGDVVIKAKRADQETDQAGKQVTVMRDVCATAQTASMPQTQDVVKLAGDVTVKITEPGVVEPIAVITGETVTVSLKDNKIRVEGPPGKPAQFVVTPKEGEKK